MGRGVPCQAVWVDGSLELDGRYIQYPLSETSLLVVSDPEDGPQLLRRGRQRRRCNAGCIRACADPRVPTGEGQD